MIAVRLVSLMNIMGPHLSLCLLHYRCDRDDAYKRDRERKVRRVERDGKTPAPFVGVMIKNEDEDDYLNIDPVHSSASWVAESERLSLKRMAHHLSVSNSYVGRVGSYTARENQGHRVPYPARRRSSRSRSDRI
jgi:hypothetical protein